MVPTDAAAGAPGGERSDRDQPLSVTLVEFNPSGGLFQFAVQLGEALARRGHLVELLTGPDPELSSRVAGFTINPLLPTWHARDGGNAQLWCRRMRRVVRAGRYHVAWGVLVRHLAHHTPDVVQFSESRFPVDGLVPAVLARRRGSPVLVALAHAPVPFNEQRPGAGVFKGGRLLHRALGLGYRSLDALLVLGEQTAHDLQAAFPAVRRVDVVPHGDEAVFLRGEVPSVSDTDPVVLFFGTMQAYKGLGVLMEAFATVRAERPAARLVLAGAASGDVALAALRQQAERVGGVELRVGYVPLPDVQELFATARVVVAPYLYANASGVVELARTFGRPVVASAVGDLPAVVRHEVAGLVVPPADPARLAAALLRLLDDPEEAQRMGQAGKAASAARSSWDVVAMQIEAVYEGCLRARGKADGESG